MARYIKANPKVAKYLHLENDRNQVKDGNYLLWQADMLAFGRLTELPQILEQIGGIALAAHEARQEQDGIVVRELPTATGNTEGEAAEPEQTESTDPVEGETETGQPTDSPEAEEPESTDPEQTENGETVETTNDETEI